MKNSAISSPRSLFGRYEDFRPYEMPESLDDLQGPASGEVRLPVHVYWQTGQKTLRLDERETPVIYQAVLSEGRVEDIRKYLNKKTLIDWWPQLSLPIKLAKQWQDRFPQLRGNLRAEWL